MIPQTLLKLLLPKIIDHLMKVFKLDKMLDYVELPNDADKRIDDLEVDVFNLKNVAHPPAIDIERIEEIEKNIQMILDETEVVEMIDESQAGDA